jgi:glucan phosphoethanolaminetransferase (alkaline phosphatase superfamily)
MPKTVSLSRNVGISLPLLPFSLIAGAIALFGSFYVGRFNATASGFAAYVAWIVFAYSVCFVCVLALAVFLHPSRVLNILGAMLFASVFCAIILHQMLVLVGLISWGAVPTVKLLTAYLNQLEHVEHFLPLSPLMLLMLMILVFIAAVALHVQWVKRIKVFEAGWRLNDAKRHKHALVLVILMLAAAWASYGLYAHFMQSKDWWDEPILKITRDARGVQFLSESIDDTKQIFLRKLEQDARKQYLVGTPAKKLPNIVVITVDALRADRLPLYGYIRNTAPFLSRLQMQGRAHIVEQARAACAESLCGLLSLQTGKQIHEFSNENFGLPEVLRLYGYKRKLILSGDHTNFYDLKALYGAADYFRDGTSPLLKDFATLDQKTKRDMNSDRLLLAHVEELPDHDGVPVLMQLHLMSTHGLAKREPEFSAWTPHISVHKGQCVDADATGNSYDNGVLASDHYIEQILLRLETKGYVQPDSIILITADHGEGLGEHGLCNHSKAVYDTQIRIPWIWIGPKVHKDLNSATIQADLAPTILGYLGLPIPKNWSGIDLASRADAGRLTFHAQGVDVAVIDSRNDQLLKFMHKRKTKTTEAYDLKADPKEQVDLLKKLPVDAGREYLRALEIKGY